MYVCACTCIYIYIYIYIHIYIHTYTFPYIWHRSLHLVSHPGLQSTPLDAHREGSMSAPSFRKNYDTRYKL